MASQNDCVLVAPIVVQGRPPSSLHPWLSKDTIGKHINGNACHIDCSKKGFSSWQGLPEMYLQVAW